MDDKIFEKNIKTYQEALAAAAQMI